MYRGVVGHGYSRTVPLVSVSIPSASSAPAATVAALSLTTVPGLDLHDVDEAVFEHVVRNALAHAVSYGDRIAGQDRKFGMANLHTLAANDVQPERLEWPLTETFLDRFAKHRTLIISV